MFFGLRYVGGCYVVLCIECWMRFLILSSIVKIVICIGMLLLVCWKIVRCGLWFRLIDRLFVLGWLLCGSGCMISVFGLYIELMSV